MNLTREPHEVFIQIINNKYLSLSKGQEDKSLQNISSQRLGFIEKTQCFKQ